MKTAEVVSTELSNGRNISFTPAIHALSNGFPSLQMLGDVVL
ncbi:MAG: hypothetical protein U5K79_05900 [Cyclobacteriaceae bacterium]|nr:hypothetical protein [Cyclobacteriaceae bacterium]